MTHIHTAFAALLALALVGCNRAALRAPGAAGSFHAARTGYVASSTVPRAVHVGLPTDARQAYYGAAVAGSGWKGCRTDPFWGDSAPRTLAAELERELRDSRIFAEVRATDDPSALVLDTEIRALCAQVRGFIWSRAAGITSLRFTLRDGERVLFERTLEDVVTDGDDEYTGSLFTSYEQAMKILVSDSLRGVLKQLLPELDAVAPPSRPAAAG